MKFLVEGLDKNDYDTTFMIIKIGKDFYATANPEETNYFHCAGAPLCKLKEFAESKGWKFTKIED